MIVPAANARPELDLGRDVHALLGLVFDRVDLAAAASHIHSCVLQRRSCFLSTPNVNFVASAARDPSFRGSVLRSDLSVADGFPIVRIARWLGVEFPERVAGADLFEKLQAAGRSPARPPIRLYLFGGPPGAGAAAAARLNTLSGGFECVGHDEASFGDVEELSSPDAIDRINASRPDFVLVALGAKKGQGWIERNRSRLTAPVVSHLGAVVNFAANTIERAPAWMQRAGLEWIWRITQEPQLVRRYWNDARFLVEACWRDVLPWILRQRLGNSPRGAGARPEFTLQSTTAGRVLIQLTGDWRRPDEMTRLRTATAHALRSGQSVEFDFGASPAVGSALLGVVSLVDAWQVTPRAVRSASLNDPAVLASFRAHGTQHLLATASPPAGYRGAGNQ